jgi:hypothetical protein
VQVGVEGKVRLIRPGRGAGGLSGILADARSEGGWAN